jgi:hypothetical protein
LQRRAGAGNRQLGSACGGAERRDAERQFVEQRLNTIVGTEQSLVGASLTRARVFSAEID